MLCGCRRGAGQASGDPRRCWQPHPASPTSRLLHAADRRPSRHGRERHPDLRRRSHRPRHDGLHRLPAGQGRAGIERAMGAGGFGAGKFAPQIYRNFVRLGAMQDAYAGMFRRFATEAEGATFDEALADQVQGDVDRMRALASRRRLAATSSVAGPPGLRPAPGGSMP
ncbi:MAG: nitrate- and nitrite sensing domain-containing protein [Hyphomicrobiales bacterium]